MIRNTITGKAVQKNFPRLESNSPLSLLEDSGPKALLRFKLSA